MFLIVGCGFLGSYLIDRIRMSSDEPITATYRSESDICAANGVKWVKCDVGSDADVDSVLKSIRNERLTVFYFAACHNVDFVYENPDAAREINSAALKKFIAKAGNIEKLYYSSTDCVYGEDCGNAPLCENSPLMPVNEYGRQKLEAENIVLQNGFTVLRLPFMIGPSLNGKRHFYDNIKSSLLEGRSVEMIDGMVRSVISYKTAADLIYRISLKDNAPQIINVCSDEALTKYQIALRIAEKCGADASLVKKISEDEGKKFFRDARASSSVMSCALLKSILGTDSIKWECE